MAAPNRKRNFETMCNDDMNEKVESVNDENTNNAAPQSKIARTSSEQTSPHFERKEDDNKNDEITEEKKKALIEISKEDIVSHQKLKQKGLIFLHQKNYEKAENLYLKSLKYQPNDATTYCRLAQIYYDTVSYHKSLISAFLALEKDPSNKDGWTLYALSWMKLKHYNFAGIAFKTAAELYTDSTMNIETKYDDEYIAAKESVDSFINDFNAKYMNLEAEFDKIQKRMQQSAVLVDKPSDLADCSEYIQFITAQDIFQWIVESKYKSLQHMIKVPQVPNCWNLTIEPMGIYRVQPAADINHIMSTQKDIDPLKIDQNKCFIFDFEKMVFRVTICNSTNGTVCWLNKGRHGYNESEWTDLNHHTVFGEPTAKQVVAIIKRVILNHRRGIKGDLVSQRPKNIVLTPYLEDEYEEIKAELKSLDIGCYLRNEVPLCLHCGAFNGSVLLY